MGPSIFPMTVPIVWMNTPNDDGKCHCETLHRPPDWRPEGHHCLPEGLGGRPTWTNEQGILTANKVLLCATTHNSVHQAIKLLMRGHPIVSGVISRYGLAVAIEGVTRINVELKRGSITPDQIDSYLTHSVVRPV